MEERVEPILKLLNADGVTRRSRSREGFLVGENGLVSVATGCQPV